MKNRISGYFAKVRKSPSEIENKITGQKLILMESCSFHQFSEFFYNIIVNSI